MKIKNSIQDNKNQKHKIKLKLFLYTVTGF